MFIVVEVAPDTGTPSFSHCIDMGVSPSIVALKVAVPSSQMVVITFTGNMGKTLFTVSVAGLEVSVFTPSNTITLYCVPPGLVALPISFYQHRTNR